MSFNFLAIAVPENGYADELKAALGKVKAAMSKGVKLTVTARMDSNGYPYLWVEIVDSHKTEGVKLLASEEIINLIFTYLTLGKIIDINIDPNSCDEMREDYSDKNFSFELFRYEVDKGKRIHKTSQAHSIRFKGFTTYTKGRVTHSLEMTEEVKAFLKEKDLL